MIAFDTSKQEGLELALIAERTTEALAELRQQGPAWNHAPFGWDIDEGAHLAVNPDEQETLARAQELRESGLGYLKIAETLNAERRATKRGGPWQAMSVRSVLRSSEKVVRADLVDVQLMACVGSGARLRR